MDPVSHAAVGRTLVAMSDRRTPGRIAAMVLGTLAPDIDAVLMPFGWDRYLRVHEAGTHSLLGTIACALLLAAVIRLFRRSARYRTLALLAWVGTLSHVVLDLLSSARHRPGWPLIDTVVSLPAVAMADPWLLGLSAAGAIAVIASSAPRSTRAAGAALAVTVAFLMIKGALGASAFLGYMAARDLRAEPIEARMIEASWASLTTWNVLDRTPRHLRFWRARARQPAEEVFSWPLAPEAPIVRTSRSMSTVRNFLNSHELSFAVALPQGANRTLVLWSDIRFCWNPDVPGARQLAPIVEAHEGATRLACALWFGGELDALGTPLREVVKIGGLSQERAPAR
jgi:membrane-bound metal-dependent hydrolase YbcI (DUF457 family)